MTNEFVTEWANDGESSRPTWQSPVEGRLVSYSLPAPEISPITFLQLAEGQERLFWQNGQDETFYAGFGAAAQLMAWGPGRFQEIGRKIESIFHSAVLLPGQPELAAPRFFGGFAFRDDFVPDNAWAVFHPAHFILPHYQLARSTEGSWLTINAVMPDNDSLAETTFQLREALQARLDVLDDARSYEIEQSIPSPEVRASYPMGYQKWQTSIQEAVANINSTRLDKVVLSRVCELRSSERINVCAALSYLNQHFEGCVRFLFEPRPYHAFYGATPEVIIQATGKSIKTMALAGSARRGIEPEEDQALAQQLLHSRKDRHEHALVVDSIRRRLEPFETQLTIPTEPALFTLSYIHHLLTTIVGRSSHAIGVLPLLEALHPTPALGGSPRDLALAFIRHAEPVPRGWYGGPVGWVNASMDGQFAVGIRSAVAQDRRVWLYAGAGIVAESDPHKEWLETALKFKPMLAALGLQPEPAISGWEVS